MLSAPGAFPPLLDIPPDADDETMVELAIALSLQEHDAGTAELQLLHNELQNLGRSVQLGNIQVDFLYFALLYKYFFLFIV